MGRLDAALAAWGAQNGDPEPAVLLVVDRSLLRDLPTADAARVSAWAAAGVAAVVPGADALLLRYADQGGLPVLSADRFLEFREEHPWIEGETERFLAAVPEAGGWVIRPRDMGFTSSWTRSRAEEDQLLRRRRLLRRGTPLADLLARRWVCRNASCGLAAKEAVLPVAAGGAAHCPACREPLHDSGPRARGVHVKLVHADRVTARFVVAAGAPPLVVGRTGDVAVDQPGVSRRHVSLAAAGGGLQVTDLSSANGTAYERWSRDRQEFAAPEPLVAGVPRELRPRDRVVLPGGVALQRAGRRYPR